MDTRPRDTSGKDKKALSSDLPPSEAPLLGEDELIFRALQIASLRAERCAREGRVTEDAAAAIRQLLDSVDGVKEREHTLDQAASLAEMFKLPEPLTLAAVIDEIRAITEVGSLSKKGDQQRLYRLVSGLSGIRHSDTLLKALSFFKGRLLWATLRLLRDPQDPRREEWLREIADSAATMQKGTQNFLKERTVEDAEALMRNALAEERERRR